MSEVLSFYKFPEKPFGKLFLDLYSNEMIEWQHAFKNLALAEDVNPNQTWFQ